MATRRIFKSEQTGSAQFTIRETRTVTTSARTLDLNSGNWKSVTTHETFSYDDGRSLNRIGAGDQLQQQFANLSIPGGKVERKEEEKSKKSFFGGFFKPKTENANVTNTSDVPKSTLVGANFENVCLETHNSYRAKHGAQPLILSKELCQYAREWAQKLAKENKFEHRRNSKYGENIYMKWSSDPNHDINGNEPVDDWYAEIKDHVFGREPSSLKSGHFTQVVWEKSRELGVGKSKSKSGKIIVVANYDPPGNMMGDFSQNVHPPRKRK
uniref:Cysteine-rich venom protein n=1 Tax=Strigamia maritima TaxID=126957 RepID=T1JLR7_STRMM